MNVRLKSKTHQHTPQSVHVLVMRAGVPYEIEQQVCTDCRAILAEKPVKRTAA